METVSPTAKVETTARTLAFGKKKIVDQEIMSARLSNPFFEDDVF